MANNIQIQDKQNLLDIAVMKFGDADKVFELLRENQTLGLEQSVPAGTEMKLGAITIEKKEIQNYTKRFGMATDITSEFIEWVLFNGWWNDELSWDDNGDWIDEPQN